MKLLRDIWKEIKEISLILHTKNCKCPHCKNIEEMYKNFEEENNGKTK